MLTLWPKLGASIIYVRGHFGHVEVAGGVHIEPRRSPDARPLAEKLAFGGEHLHPVVLPVCHEYVFVFVYNDVVGNDELTLAGAGLAPRVDKLTLRAEAVDARVAVAVGHEQVSRNGGDGKMGGTIEGLTAESIGRAANGLKQFPFRGELSYDVMLGVRAVDGVVGCNGDAVGATEDAVAPGGQIAAVPVEYHHGVFSASVDEDSTLGIHHRAGAVPE